MADEKKLKILIIDDDDPIRGMYADVFHHEGFEVEEAIDGVEGLDKATKNPPNIIFTGIVMPRMDGFMLIEALAKNVVTANVPVIISSHLGREEDKQRAAALGVKDFIVRNVVTPKEAVERVRKVLGAGEYKVKLNINELDARQLIRDIHLQENFQCSYCGADLILVINMTDVSTHEFSARIVCPNCGRV